MKIFNWMRSRRNGNEGSCNKPCPQSISHNSTRMHPCNNDEFSDWPNGLLAIGTFGNGNLKGVEHPSNMEKNAAPEGSEEVDKDDLKALLNKCVVLDDSIDKFLDSLRGEETTTCDDLVHSGSKDVRKNNNKGGSISKKSFSYLLKKAFLCKGGFAPTPIVRDLLPDPKLDPSRLEKILRAMLHKKIYPQRPSRTATPQKKYLDKPEIGSYDKEPDREETSPKSKWDKTDSEYIVLEI